MATKNEEILCKEARIDSFVRSNGVIANFIYEQYKKSGKKEIIIVNIGTDRMTGDAFAPMLGTKLKENDCKFTVYGDLNRPIHAMNVKRRKEEIYNEHKDAFIIGVDASTSNKLTDTHSVIVKNKPVYPGKGVGKDLPNVGDVGILGITYIENDILSTIKGMKSVRLGDVYNLVKKTAEEIQILETLVTNRKLKIAK